MFEILAGLAAVAIVVVLAYAATRPDEFRIARAATIAAPAEAIFPMIDDFRRWADWSPWETKDPNMKRTLGGSARGPGAVYAWKGNSSVGEGRMEIRETAPPRRVAIDLEFALPMKARNVVEFTLEPDGAGTRVTWAMRGPSPFISKLMGLVFNMDKMVGGDFEAGLAKLKALAEAGR
jgi:uncharacterized protein YndB with AHSA1/START domain